MATFDPKKFSIAELTSNSDGKTSGSGTVGVAAGLASVWVFTVGITTAVFVPSIRDFMMLVLPFTITVLTVGAALLGYRKGKSSDQAISASSDATVQAISDDNKPLNS